MSQFHEHFMLAFFIRKPIEQLFSKYNWLCDFLAPKFSYKNALIKRWWNWRHEVHPNRIVTVWAFLYILRCYNLDVHIFSQNSVLGVRKKVESLTYLPYLYLNMQQNNNWFKRVLFSFDLFVRQYFFSFKTIFYFKLFFAPWDKRLVQKSVISTKKFLRIENFLRTL